MNPNTLAKQNRYTYEKAITPLPDLCEAIAEILYPQDEAMYTQIKDTLQTKLEQAGSEVEKSNLQKKLAAVYIRLGAKADNPSYNNERAHILNQINQGDLNSFSTNFKPEDLWEAFSKSACPTDLGRRNTLIDRLKAQHNTRIGQYGCTEASKEILREELLALYRRIAAKGEKALSADKKEKIIYRLEEELHSCYPGFTSRVSIVCLEFNLPKTINSLLTLIRTNLLIEAASTQNLEIHSYNAFLRAGKQNFNTIISQNQETDPFPGSVSDNQILQILRPVFLKYDSPLVLMTKVCELMQEVLQEHYFYLGRRENGYKAADLAPALQYLQELGIENPHLCLLRQNYPYTDDSGSCVLARVSFSPANKPIEELKALLGQQSGLILHNNTLYCTDYKNGTVHELGEFEEDDTPEALAVKALFDGLTLDAMPNALYLATPKMLANIRNNLPLIEGQPSSTLVDLDWFRIKASLLRTLIETPYFEQTPALKNSFNSLVNYYYDINQGEQSFLNFRPFFQHLIHEEGDLDLFLKMADHLSIFHKLTLIKEYLETGKTLPVLSLLRLTNLLKPQTEAEKIQVSSFLEEYEVFAIIKVQIRTALNTKNTKNINELHLLVKENTELNKFFKEEIGLFVDNLRINERTTEVEKTFYYHLIQTLEPEKKVQLLSTLYRNTGNRLLCDEALIDSIIQNLATLSKEQQTTLLLASNGDNHSFVMAVLIRYMQVPNAQLSEKITKLLKYIEKLDKNDLYTLLKSRAQFNLLHYAAKTGQYLGFLNLLSLLPPAEQIEILNQDNQALVVNPQNPAVKQKMLQILNNLPQPEKNTYLFKWFDGLLAVASRGRAGFHEKEELLNLLKSLLSKPADNRELLELVFAKKEFQALLTDASMIEWLDSLEQNEWIPVKEFYLVHLNLLQFNLTINSGDLIQNFSALLISTNPEFVSALFKQTDPQGNNILQHACIYAPNKALAYLDVIWLMLPLEEQLALITQKNASNHSIYDQVKASNNNLAAKIRGKIERMFPQLVSQPLSREEPDQTSETDGIILIDEPELTQNTVTQETNSFFTSVAQTNNTTSEAEIEFEPYANTRIFEPAPEPAPNPEPEPVNEWVHFAQLRNQLNLGGPLDLSLFQKIIHLPLNQQTSLFQGVPDPEIQNHGVRNYSSVLHFVALHCPDLLKDVLKETALLPLQKQIDLYAQAGVHFKKEHKISLFSSDPLQHYEIQMVFQLALLKKKVEFFELRADREKANSAYQVSCNLYETLQTSFNQYKQKEIDINQFDLQVEQSIREAKPVLSKHRGAAKILETLAKILLCLSLIGLGYFIYKQKKNPGFSLIKTDSCIQLEQINQTKASLMALRVN